MHDHESIERGDAGDLVDVCFIISAATGRRGEYHIKAHASGEKIDPARHKFGIGVKAVTFQYGNRAGRLWMDGAGDRRYARIEPLPGSGVIEFLFRRMKTEIS
jgi:hypothetical protein